VAAWLDVDRVGYSDGHIDCKSCEKINPEQMKTKMRDTSLEAYRTTNFSEQEKKVLAVLIQLKGRATNKEIAKYANMYPSTVSGRMNTLVKHKIVKAGEKVIDPETNKKVQQWHFPPLHLKLL
jgi:predicted HTH transcriptional regulator